MKKIFKNSVLSGGKKLPALLTGIYIIVLSVAGGGLTNFFLGQKDRSQGRIANRADKEYVLYIGLNDKDEYTQLISTEDAENEIRKIFMQYLDGYTVMSAEGIWVDEKGVPTTERMLVCSVYGAEEQDILQIMDAVLEELNQNTILLEERSVTYIYYGGPEKGRRQNDKERM